MKVYVDSSVVVRRILDQPGAFQNWSEWQRVVTSELLRLEAYRVLDRMRIHGKLSVSEIADILASLRAYTVSFEQVPLQSKILDRAASPFPTALGTLDAIHLATALLWVEENEEALTFLTHDAELAIATRACGLDVKTSP